MHKLLIVAICVLVGAAVAWLVSCGKPMTIEGELAKVPAADRQALDKLLEGTGLIALQLTPIGAGVARGFGVLQHHQHAVAVEDGRIVEVRLSDVPLPHPEALTQFTGLQAVWLSGNHLTTLPDLSGLKGLVSVNISQNQFHDLTFLNGVGTLTDLDITGNPGVVAPDPKPAKLVLKTDANPTGAPPKASAPAHPANWVATIPKMKGKAGSGTTEGMVTQGSYSVKGTISSFSGVLSLYQIPGTYNTGGAGGSTVEISVEKGRVRAYLEYVPAGDAFMKMSDGYVYAEAEPGKTGKVQGILPAYHSDSTFTLALESVEGEAQGVKYHIYR